MGVDPRFSTLSEIVTFRGSLPTAPMIRAFGELKAWAAVFSMDSYGIVRGLIEGALPPEIEAE